MQLIVWIHYIQIFISMFFCLFVSLNVKVCQSVLFLKSMLWKDGENNLLMFYPMSNPVVLKQNRSKPLNYTHGTCDKMTTGLIGSNMQLHRSISVTARHIMPFWSSECTRGCLLIRAQILPHSLFVPEGKGWGKEITCCLIIKHKNTSGTKVPIYTDTVPLLLNLSMQL